MKTAMNERNTRAQLVTHYRNVVLSSTYTLFWQSLSQAAETTDSPILNYHLSNQMYIAIMNTQKPEKQNEEERAITLTPDEMAAISYIGGYIVRKLIKKITKKNPDNKNDFLLLLFYLLQDPESSEDVQLVDVFDIHNWSKLIDRGGLFHCVQLFTNTLLQMEKKAKHTIDHLKNDNATIGKIKTNIMQCNEISKKWNDCFTDEQDETQKRELLNYVVEEYMVFICSKVYGALQI